ncbi:MAG: YraN family protein [Candidatus Cloacimonetes bacterium]|nr:YraN family protein [Candidatus Cloacimonadota bacterium]
MNKYLKKEKGNKAENQACRYLKKHGYKVLERNFSCKSGEIDLIAYDKQHKELVFVEVRFRLSGIDDAIASINYPKQLKITRAAQYYLLLNPRFADSFTRFDVIAISLDQKKKWLIKLIPDAFRS